MDQGFGPHFSRIRRGLRRALGMKRDESGQFALIFALSLPVVIALGGFALDYSLWFGQSNNIHAAADAASLAAARELQVADPVPTRIQAVAAAVVDANIAVPKGFGGQYTSSSEILDNGGAVAVTVTQTKMSYFSGAIGLNPGSITTRSVARLVGGGKICVVTLDPKSAETMRFEANSRLTGEDCGIYSNAKSSTGIIVKAGGEIVAGLVCSAGGIALKGGKIGPKDGLTDCPSIADPFGGRPVPVVSGACRSVPKLKSGSTALQPGRYCDKVVISGTASVTLANGIYQFERGLFVTDNAELIGTNAGLVFKTRKSIFDFSKNARIDLSGPTAGTMAGVLMWQDPTGFTPGSCSADNSDEHDDYEEDEEENRTAPAVLSKDSDKNCSKSGYLRFKIRSERARRLVGAIYLPMGSLLVDSKQPVADQSPWTAIVTRQLELDEGPDLRLHTNYSLTTVPVPTGISASRATAKIYLEQ